MLWQSIICCAKRRRIQQTHICIISLYESSACIYCLAFPNHSDHNRQQTHAARIERVFSSESTRRKLVWLRNFIVEERERALPINYRRSTICRFSLFSAIFSPWLVAQTYKLRVFATSCVTHQLFHSTESFLKYVHDNINDEFWKLALIVDWAIELTTDFTCKPIYHALHINDWYK